MLDLNCLMQGWKIDDPSNTLMVEIIPKFLLLNTCMLRSHHSLVLLTGWTSVSCTFLLQSVFLYWWRYPRVVTRSPCLLMWRFLYVFSLFSSMIPMCVCVSYSPFVVVVDIFMCIHVYVCTSMYVMYLCLCCIPKILVPRLLSLN